MSTIGTMTRSGLATRLVFACLCLGALAIGLSAYGLSDIQRANERRLGGQLMVMILGFPTGFFGAGAFSDVARHFGYQTFDVAATPARYVADWLILVLLGYVQWFLFVPAAWRMISRMSTRLRSG